MEAIRENHNQTYAESNRSWEVSPNGYIYIIVLPSMAQGLSQKKDWKIVEAREYQKVCCEVISPRNYCINKTGTLSVDMLTKKGGDSAGSQPYRNNYRQLIMAAWGILSLSQDEPLLIVQWRVVSSETMYIQTKMESSGCIYVFECIYMHAYM